MSPENGPRYRIDQATGNSVSQIFDKFGRQTWPNGGEIFPVVEYGQGFSSFRGIPLDAIGAPGYILGAGADGIGTKIEVAERMENHRTMGYDLVAMTCDDVVIRGGEPIALTNTLDANTLDIPQEARQLAEGMRDAANLAGVEVINGEAANLGPRVNGYGPFNYNWGSTVIWMVQRERIIDNTAVEPGDLIVGFEDTGLRSNGHTEARTAFNYAFGEDWHEVEVGIGDGMKKIGEMALRPSVIYTPLMVELTGGHNPDRAPRAAVHGAAHITGGGLPEKLGRTLKNSGLGAEIVDPFDLPPVMTLAQHLHPSNLSDEDIYRTWHCGQGMVNIVPEDEAETVIRTADEHGISAKVICYVSNKPGMRIMSRGLRQPDKMLSFEA